MKNFILAAVAAATLATPAMAAPQQYRGNDRAVERQTTVRHTPSRTVVTQRKVVHQPTYRQWHRGDRFDARYTRNYRQIDYRHVRGLRAPPRGYRYVQSGNDALLVGIASGIIGAVIVNAIH